MPETTKQGVSKKSLIITCVIAGLLLLVSNSAIWINRQIFNTQAFSETAVNSITSQSSRDAMAAKIVDEALSNHPKIQNVVDDSLIKLISGLLDGDRLETVLSKSVSKLQIYLTSADQQDVVINLAGSKNVINRLVEVSGRDEAAGNVQQKLEGIPDQIVIIEEKNIPDFYNYGIAMNFLAPLTFLAAVILLAYPYFRNLKNYLSIMAVQGAALIIVGSAALLIGPLFRPVALGPIQDPNVRVVAGNLYDSFISTFNNQTFILIIIGLAVCAAALIIKAVSIYRISNKSKTAQSK